ncbi:hypothetical protein HMPREF3224_02339 [Anaerococcus hydrogenalis]|nr:hypothetical protein HMPREF3224_02339 [Anaerococcus hydrogenalis]
MFQSCKQLCQQATKTFAACCKIKNVCLINIILVEALWSSG